MCKAGMSAADPRMCSGDARLAFDEGPRQDGSPLAEGWWRRDVGVRLIGLMDIGLFAVLYAGTAGRLRRAAPEWCRGESPHAPTRQTLTMTPVLAVRS